MSPSAGQPTARHVVAIKHQDSLTLDEHVVRRFRADEEASEKQQHCDEDGQTIFFVRN
jgi:hypothetical protein